MISKLSLRTGMARWAPSRLCLFLGLLLLAAGQLTGQTLPASSGGTISGTIMDGWADRPLGGAVVMVRGTTLATTSDPAGKFELQSVPPGDQIVTFSKPGYARAVVADVRVAAGQSSRVNIQLRPEFYDMEEYEVTAEIVEEQSVALLQDRQKALALTDSIGAEQFSRQGASDAADIVGKLPGITIAEGKTPVVRGLNERYVGMQLNGAEVPSPDPYKKTAPLDLFPASMISKIVVNKSFTPDQPGNFTGGGVNIITKSFPEKWFFNLSSGVSYNPQANLNENFLGYEGGGTDWLGMDDGARALPESVAGLTSFPVPPTSTGNRTSSTYNARKATAAQVESINRALGTPQFAPVKQGSDLNSSFGATTGDTILVGGRPFGYFAGLSYNRAFSYYEDGVSRRRGALNTLTRDFDDTKAVEEVSWSAALNLAYQPTDQHELGFNYLFNQSSEDSARISHGTLPIQDPQYIFYQNRLHWTERNLTTYQIRGGHESSQIPDLRLDWLGAFSQTSQEEPDTRFFNYRSFGAGGPIEFGHNSLPTPTDPTRYFRDLSENNKNLKMDLTIPFTQWTEDGGKIKLGGFLSLTQRSYVDKEVYYRTDLDPDFGRSAGDPNDFLNPSNLGPTTTTNSSGNIRYAWPRYTQTRQSNYEADGEVVAGYSMVDLPLYNKLNFIGGFRVEKTSIDLLSESYQAHKLTGRTVNPAVLDETAVLPAAGLVFKVVTNMNVRLNYSQTIARPSFRELAAYRQYDPVLDEVIEGEPNLKISEIQNYDLRWEWFPRPGDVLAVSLFYKDVTDAIERLYLTQDADIITYTNRVEAKVYGVEFEARKNLGFMSDHLKNFSLGGNLALIQSEVPLTPNEVSNRSQSGIEGESRQLFDQSPYIVNFDAGYNNDRSGTGVTVVYSVFGPRITIGGIVTDDIYEQPSPTLDLVISQRIWKGMKLKLTAKNLMDPDIQRTYGKDGESLYSSYRRGRTYGLSLSYDF